MGVIRVWMSRTTTWNTSRNVGKTLLRSLGGRAFSEALENGFVFGMIVIRPDTEARTQ